MTVTDNQLETIPRSQLAALQQMAQQADIRGAQADGYKAQRDALAIENQNLTAQLHAANDLIAALTIKEPEACPETDQSPTNTPTSEPG
jgi:hypothetical protein